MKSPLPSSPASGISASSPIRSKPSVRQDASSRPSTPTKKATAPRAATPAGTPAETKRNQTATAAERTPEPPAAVDEDQTWEVERLVADALYFPSPKAGKTEKPVRLFRVRWAGDWPPDQKETWEPEENISPALVRDYLRRRAAKKERRRGASGRGRGPGSGKAGGKAAGVAQGQGVATTTTQGRKDRRSPVGSSSGARDGSVTGGSPQPIVSHAYTSVSDAVAGEPVLASAGPAAETLSTAEIEELSRGDGGGSSIDGSAGVDDVLSVDDERLLVAEEDDDEDESDGDGRRDNERTTNAAARNDPLGQDAGTTASPPARIVGGLGGVARGLESLLAMEFAKLARWGS